MEGAASVIGDSLRWLVRSRPPRRVVYTAIFGGYDSPKDIPPTTACEAVCFTDDPELQAPGWSVRAVEPAHTHPRMAAKWFRAMSHAVLAEYDQSLWLDASVVIDDPGFVDEAFEILRCGPIGMFLHPDRTCIYSEADVSAQMLKYQGQPLYEQVAHYRRSGHPVDWGLYATGILARDHRSRIVAELNRRWWQENLRWSYQDQLSMPVVLRELGIRPAVFAHNLWRNPWFHLAPHTRED